MSVRDIASPTPTMVDDMEKMLLEDGMDPLANEEQKTYHLWKMYLRSQSCLKASLRNLEQLRQQQTEEMQEVEKYVEHIRTLSDEREALTLEFEAENEQLKGQVDHFRSQLLDMTSQKEEVKDMLLEQSLEEVADSSSSEQVAFLLEDRARLLDELEAEQMSNKSGGSESGHKKLITRLKQEKVQLEQKMRLQNEALKNDKEQTIKTHEEEIYLANKERDELGEELKEYKNKVAALESRSSLDSPEKHLKVDVDALKIKAMQSEVLKAKEEKKKSDREVLALKGKNKSLQLEKKNMDNAKDSRLNRTFSPTMESSPSKLKEDFEKAKKQISELKAFKANVQSLEAEKRTLEMKLGFSQKENEEVKKREREKNQLLRASGESIEKLKRDIDILKEEYQSAKLEVNKSKNVLSSERDNTDKLTGQLQAAEKTITSEIRDHEKVTHSLKDKIKNLDNKVDNLEDELALNQQEIHSTQKDYQKMLSDARTEITELQGKLDNERMSKHADQDRLAEVLKLEEGNRDLKQRCETVFMENEATKRDLEKAKHEISIHTKQTDSLTKELEGWKTKFQKSTEYDRETMTRNNLLESDNKELSKKLSTALIRAEDVQRELKIEKDKGTAFLLNNDEKLHSSRQELVNLQKQVEQLTEDVSKKKNEISKLQTNIAKGGSELKVLKLNHDREITSISHHLEAAYKENSELQKANREKDEEVQHLQSDSSQAKSNVNKYEAKIESESKIREDLENRNTMLEQEMSKVWNQMRDLLEKTSNLETAKKHLEDELERKSTMSRQTETVLNQRTSDQGRQLHEAETKVDVAEKRVSELQGDLDEALSRLQAAETQLREAASTRVDLQNKRDELIRMKNQIQEEKLQRSVLSQGNEELRQQLSGIKDRETKANSQTTELQHQLLDMEAKISSIQNESKSVSDLHYMSEQNKRELADEASRLHREIETLQLELLAAIEKGEYQTRRLDRLKVKTKTKLTRAREIYHREKSRLREQIYQVQEMSKLTKASLEKELEWKSRIEETQHKLIQEKRDLLAQNSEKDEIVRDKSRELTLLESRARYLETENTQLQDKIDSLVRQKSGLEKLIKDIKIDRQREVCRSPTPVTGRLSPTHFNSGLSNTSDLTSTLNGHSAWDPGFIDTVITAIQRSTTPIPHRSATPSPLRSQTPLNLPLRSQTPGPHLNTRHSYGNVYDYNRTDGSYNSEAFDSDCS